MNSLINLLSLERIIIIFNTLVIFILLILNMKNNIKMKKIKYKYEKFMNGLSDRNIEELLTTYIDKTGDLNEKTYKNETKINEMESKLKKCMQKMGIVRFSAFDNVGSDLSYSVALLDENNGGVVLTSIYSRDNSTTYAKPVVNGNSKNKLSAEEIKAIDEAMKS